MLKVESKKDKLPSGCENYKWLTNSKRKTTSATLGVKCDKSGDSYTSPDWQGADWYRIDPSIGTKIPTSATKYQHCGFWGSGYISGGSTPGVGQTIDAKVCFYYNNDNCITPANIKIKNCNDYLIYYLPDVPGCYRGYCVE